MRKLLFVFSVLTNVVLAQSIQITEQDELLCQVVSAYLSRCYVVCTDQNKVGQVVQEFDSVLQSAFGITDWYERKSIKREFIYACQASCYSPKFREAMIEGHLHDAFYDECIDSLIESRS